MNWIKIILAVLGIFLAVAVIFLVLGIVYTVLWYAFWIALLGAVGYGGYKLFFEKDRETAQLGEKKPIGISEMQNIERELEEIKRKYLPK
jgi:hypothetical protein